MAKRGIAVVLSIILILFIIFGIFWHNRTFYVENPNNPIYKELAVSIPVLSTDTSDYSTLVMTKTDNSGRYEYTYFNVNFTVKGDVWYNFNIHLKLKGTTLFPNPTFEEWLNIHFPLLPPSSYVELTEDVVSIDYDSAFLYIDYNNYVTKVSPVKVYSFKHFPIINAEIIQSNTISVIQIKQFYFNSDINDLYVYANGDFVVNYFAQIIDVMANTRPTGSWDNILDGLKSVFYDYPKWLISFFELISESYGGIF